MKYLSVSSNNGGTKGALEDMPSWATWVRLQVSDSIGLHQSTININICNIVYSHVIARKIRTVTRKSNGKDRVMGLYGKDG